MPQKEPTKSSAASSSFTGNTASIISTAIVNAIWLVLSVLASVIPSPRFPTLQQKRICLLIAHPDDEAMFFAPSLLALSRKELNNQILILCLSSGDADGLGHIRKQELVESALQLGVTHPEHVVCIEDERFPDSMTTTWDAEEISKILTHYFAPNASASRSGKQVPVSIDAIITFDKDGVSNHPNHKSLYYGAISFVRSLQRPSWEDPVKLYTLTSTNIVRKYSGFIDCISTTLLAFTVKRQRGVFPTPLISISGPNEIRKAQSAMTTAHKSQMRWFRWAWITISRYMIVNDLVRVTKF